MYGFGRVQSQAIIDSIKHCELTVITDGRDDLVIHCLNPNQSYAASLDRLDGLYYVVLQQSQNPPETSEGLTHTYIKKNNHI